MPIFTKTGINQPIRGAATFNVPSVGSNRQAAAISHHTRSMLSQASRNPRLTNIASVSAQLKAHAGRVGIQQPKGSRR